MGYHLRVLDTQQVQRQLRGALNVSVDHLLAVKEGHRCHHPAEGTATQG